MRPDREGGAGQTRGSSRPSIWQRAAALGTVSILAAMALFASPIPAEPVFAQDLVAVDEVLDDPSWYYGQTITVSGPIGDVIGPHALTIETFDDLFSDDLLVVDAGRLQDLPGWGLATTEELEDGTRVTVIGTVRPFVLTAVEEDLGVDLADHLLADREGAPVIVADWIDLIPGAFDNPFADLFTARPAPAGVAKVVTSDQNLGD